MTRWLVLWVLLSPPVSLGMGWLIKAGKKYQQKPLDNWSHAE